MRASSPVPALVSPAPHLGRHRLHLKDVSSAAKTAMMTMQYLLSYAPARKRLELTLESSSKTFAALSPPATSRASMAGRHDYKTASKPSSSLVSARPRSLMTDGNDTDPDEVASNLDTSSHQPSDSDPEMRPDESEEGDQTTTQSNAIARPATKSQRSGFAELAVLTKAYAKHGKGQAAKIVAELAKAKFIGPQSKFRASSLRWLAARLPSSTNTRTSKTRKCFVSTGFTRAEASESASTSNSASS